MKSTAGAPDVPWRQFYAEHWSELGPETKSAIVDHLPDDWSFEGKRLLDFGCGPGRTLQHFVDEATVAEIWGVDIHAPSIETVVANYCPPVHAMTCEVEPPLEFDASTFDLVWAISVFTHLTDQSLRWLLELHRILRPGGILIATYIGQFHSELLADESWDPDRVGMNVLRHDAGWDEGAPMVLMSDWWVRNHWGRAFEIVEIVPQIHNQSWAVMRKRDVELTVDELAKPADDPREWTALRHNLSQTQRELEVARTEASERELQIRREFEQSASWRVTAPVRSAMRWLRRRFN